MTLSKSLFSSLALYSICSVALAGYLQVNVLDKDGKPVPDAVVVLVSSNLGSPKVALPQQISILQEKMRFIPAITIVGVGAKARFINNDTWEHHVRGSAAGVMQFNADTADGFVLRIDGKAEGKAAKTADAVFDKAGAILLGCHLHASMRGHVYVSDSPWAMLTNAEGTASFDALPDGAVQVKVWHADQFIDIAPQRVNLTSSPAKVTMNLTVTPRKKRI
jgi:plastocyanin